MKLNHKGTNNLFVKRKMCQGVWNNSILKLFRTHLRIVFILSFMGFNMEFVQADVASNPLDIKKNTILIGKGVYAPFFREKGEKDKELSAFRIDSAPVTNEDFYNFVQKNPNWSKKEIPQIFADIDYLSQWGKENKPKEIEWRQPVTQVSWFAARAFCDFQKGRLALLEEWEYAADAMLKDNLDIILKWYSQPNGILNQVKQNKPNKYGLYDMHGLIWEWVEDFSAVIISGDSRSSNETNKALFCGSGSMNAARPEEYATFMRFAYRNSLKASYTQRNLGFRCVYSP